MSLSHSPKIVTSGLVFAYDMGNGKKSWKGAPTTNLITASLSGMQGVSLTFLSLDNGWKKYAMSGTFTAGTYPYTMNMTSTSYTGGVTYSSSCFIKTNVAYKFNYFGTGMNYVNQAMTKGGTSFSIAQPDGSLYVGRSNFAYTATTTQVGYLLTNPINNTTFNASTDFVWFKNGQVELGEFPTSFAGDSTTRSNTQALVDLTGNNTVTASSLTYNSDGSFSFNGSNNFAVFPENSALNVQTPSIEVWVKPNALSQNGFWFEKGTVNSQYSLFQEGGNIVFRTHNGTTHVSLTLASSTNLSTSNYTHCVATIEGGLKKIYINGVLKTSVAWTSTIPTNANGCSMGAYGGFNGGRSFYYNGSIGSVKVYNQVLTAAEVTQNFNALRGRYGI